MAKVRVGLIGCGFVAELHMYAYPRVHGVEAQVSAACARGLTPAMRRKPIATPSLRAKRSNPGRHVGYLCSWIASSPFGLLAMTVAP